jgi:hypothetical protein
MTPPKTVKYLVYYPEISDNLSYGEVEKFLKILKVMFSDADDLILPSSIEGLRFKGVRISTKYSNSYANCVARTYRLMHEEPEHVKSIQEIYAQLLPFVVAQTKEGARIAVLFGAFIHKLFSDFSHGGSAGEWRGYVYKFHSYLSCLSIVGLSEKNVKKFLQFKPQLAADSTSAYYGSSEYMMDWPLIGWFSGEVTEDTFAVFKGFSVDNYRWQEGAPALVDVGATVNKAIKLLENINEAKAAV